MSKLTELRRRTDQDLLILLDRDLERALALVHVASGNDSPFYREAVRIHEKIEALLPTISDPEERKQLAPKLAELRLALDSENRHTRANCSSAGSAQQYQGSFR